MVELGSIPDKTDKKKARFALVEEDALEEPPKIPLLTFGKAKSAEVKRNSSESSDLARELRSDASGRQRRRTEPPRQESTDWADLIEKLPANKKKNVRFKTLAQACAEVLTYQVSEDSQAGGESYVKLFDDASESSCCRRCVRMLFPMFDLDDPSFVSEEIEDHSHTWMQVPLWKMNSDVDFDTGAADILNWRYRHFVMQECKSQLAMMYTSEKDNGSLHLGCVLYKDGEVVPWEIARKVTLNESDEDTQAKVIRSMEEYDIAFSTRQHKAYYTTMVPAFLYPLKITWSDKMGVERQLVLASGDPQVASQLLAAFKKVTQIFKFRDDEIEAQKE